MSAEPAFKRGQRVRLLGRVQSIPPGAEATVEEHMTYRSLGMKIHRYLIRYGSRIASAGEGDLEPIETEGRSTATRRTE